MYNNYYLNSSHKWTSLKQNIDKLPLNIADTIRLQGKYINRCDGVLRSLLNLFQSPSLNVRIFMITTGMLMNDIIYYTRELISDPICVNYLFQTRPDFTESYRLWQTSGINTIKHLAFMLYSKMGPLGEPILPGQYGYEEDNAFNDNPFDFGKKVNKINRDIKYLI